MVAAKPIEMPSASRSGAIATDASKRSPPTRQSVSWQEPPSANSPSSSCAIACALRSASACAQKGYGARLPRSRSRWNPVMSQSTVLTSTILPRSSTVTSPSWIEAITADACFAARRAERCSRATRALWSGASRRRRAVVGSHTPLLVCRMSS